MQIADIAYLAFITLALCFSYFILIYLFPLSFAQKVPSPRKNLLPSLIYVVIGSVLAYALSFSIHDPWFANRILHIFGGGFMGFFVCFLAARDSSVCINKFQFLVFSILIVLALSVANELFELVLQNCFGFISATSVDDTWLDLASNVIGIILASICFVPFHKGNAPVPKH